MTRTAEIEELIRRGERVRSRFLDVRYLTAPAGRTRVGIVVPKFGMTIVRRNLLKRRLRELTRVHLLHTAQSQDVLIRARANAYDASIDALRSDIREIATRLTGARGPSTGVDA